MVNIGCFSVANANGTFVPTAVLEEINGTRIGIHCFSFLDSMMVNMKAEWAGNLIAADLIQSVTATGSEDSIQC